MCISPVLRQAREMLENVTPLKKDCGSLCDHACCQSLAEEESGMLLFPGESAYYANREGYRLQPCAQGTLLLCAGTCKREERPLSCRLFPLLPLVRGREVRVALDRRGRQTCPLLTQGKQALDPRFVEAVEAVGKLLLTQEEQRDFLLQLTGEQDEWKRLSLAFGGK